MKIANYKMIPSNLKGLFRRRSGRNEQTAERDWKMILIVFIIVNVISATLNFYVFWGIKEGTIFSISDNTTTAFVTINRKGLDEIVSYFESRQRNFDDLRKNRIPMSDPAI